MRVLAAPAESIFDCRLPGGEVQAKPLHLAVINTFSDVLAETERGLGSSDDPRFRSELFELRVKLAQARLELR